MTAVPIPRPGCRRSLACSTGEQVHRVGPRDGFPPRSHPPTHLPSFPRPRPPSLPRLSIAHSDPAAGPRAPAGRGCQRRRRQLIRGDVRRHLHAARGSRVVCASGNHIPPFRVIPSNTNYPFPSHPVNHRSPFPCYLIDHQSPLSDKPRDPPITAFRVIPSTTEYSSPSHPVNHRSPLSEPSRDSRQPTIVPFRVSLSSSDYPAPSHPVNHQLPPSELSRNLPVTPFPSHTDSHVPSHPVIRRSPLSVSSRNLSITPLRDIP